jgi:hypothetical protein
MPESFPLDYVGRFNIGTHQPGAPLLIALLTVPQNKQ